MTSKPEPQITLPDDAYQTDTMMFALCDRKPVACAWKQEGTRGRKWTACTVAFWLSNSLEVQMMHKDDPAAKAMLDEVWRLA